MVRVFVQLRWFVVATAVCVAFARVGLAQTENKAAPLSWELSPYRVQVCVIVEPSAHLSAGLEAELSAHLVSMAEATYGGPWQVSANQGLIENRGKQLRHWFQVSEKPSLKSKPEADKVILLAVREAEDGFHIRAREVDFPTDFWNNPVERVTTQASRLGSEAFAALQAATGPTLRIDGIEKDTVTATLRAGSIPKRDGTFLSVDRNAVFLMQLQPIDKNGKTAGDLLVFGWTYLTPLGTSSGGSSRATVKCRLHTAVSAKSFPDYHPLQLRLASAIPKSTKSSRLMLMDLESPPAALEGYDVSLAPLDGSGPSAAPQRIGTTNRSGEITIPTGDGGLRYLVISHGGEPLFRRPYLPGFGGDLKISIPNDRLRLELAAEITAAQDEFFDTMGRLTILGARRAEAMAKRDLTTLNRVLGEMDSAKSLPALTSRVAALEAKLAAADETTRTRLAPAVAQFKAQVDEIKSKLASGGQ